MGSTSSMLTQYDIEEVQDHCNHACESASSAAWSPSPIWFWPDVIWSDLMLRGDGRQSRSRRSCPCTSASASSTATAAASSPPTSSCPSPSSRSIPSPRCAPLPPLNSSHVGPLSSISAISLVLPSMLGARKHATLRVLDGTWELCDRGSVIIDCNWMLLCFYQRLLRMLDGLNFKEFVAFLSAFSPRTSLQQKIECRYQVLKIPH